MISAVLLFSLFGLRTLSLLFFKVYPISMYTLLQRQLVLITMTAVKVWIAMALAIVHLSAWHRKILIKNCYREERPLFLRKPDTAYKNPSIRREMLEFPKHLLWVSCFCFLCKKCVPTSEASLLSQYCIASSSEMRISHFGNYCLMENEDVFLITDFSDIHYKKLICQE